MISLVPLPYRLLALALAVAGLIAGYLAWAAHQQGIGEQRATARYTATLEAQKREAAATLAHEIAKTAAVEKQLQASKDQQEITDANNQKTITNMAGRLRTLAGISGRLRDPNADSGCGDGGGHGTAQPAPAAGLGDDHAAQAPGLLSADLSGLLQRLTQEADEINNAYTSCRADSQAVREISGRR